jgi:hypothetical protein
MKVSRRAMVVARASERAAVVTLSVPAVARKFPEGFSSASFRRMVTVSFHGVLRCHHPIFSGKGIRSIPPGARSGRSCGKNNFHSQSDLRQVQLLFVITPKIGLGTDWKAVMGRTRS